MLRKRVRCLRRLRIVADAMFLEDSELLWFSIFQHLKAVLG